MKWLLAPLLALGICMPALAEDDGPVRLQFASVPVDFLLWAPDAPEYRYADLAVTPERRQQLEADNALYVSRAFRTHVHLRADGDIEETNLYSRFYINGVGIQDQGNLSFWVDAFSQTAKIAQAYTLLPNGRRIDVDPATIQIVADSSDDIFTDSFEAVVPFSGLEPGAIAVLETTILHKADAMALPWSQGYFAQLLRPEEEFEVLLTWDEGRSEPTWRSDFADLKCSHEALRAVRCRAVNIPAHPDDPDIWYADVLPVLVVAESMTWPELAQRYRALFDATLSGNEIVDRTLNDLLQGSDSMEDRLHRIHRFVSQEIRYLGLEHGLGGVIPRPTAQTLQRRFGDCKDKTALFIDMARRAGFDAYPVLTSTKRFNPDKLLVPASHYFNHMVACAELEEKKEYCVDLTEPYSPYNESAYTLSGAIRLDLTETAKAPRVFRVAPYFRVKEVRTTNTIGSDGTLEEAQETIYTGPNAAWVRGTLLREAPDERQALAQDWYHDYVSTAVDPVFEFGGLDDVRTAVTLRSKAQYKDFMDRSGLDSYSEQDGWLQREASAAKTENTKHDYVLYGTLYRSEYVTRFPEGYRVRYAGPTLRFDTEFGHLRRHYETSDGQVRVTTELSLPQQKVPVHRIPDFNAFMEIIRENAKLWVALEKIGRP